jgi:hypothetical protein
MTTEGSAMLQRFLAVAAALSLGGCVTGGMTLQQPDTTRAVTNVKIILKPRDAVWATAIPALGKQFYVINNVDKSSGLVNLSFAGDPRTYIDCGHVTTVVNNARGEYRYTFDGASPEERYQAYSQQGGFVTVHRKMAIEGRINLIFEEDGPSSTKVTANVRYTVTRSGVQQAIGNPTSQPFSDVIGFNSKGGDVFTPSSSGSMRCVSTGKLETDILSLIQ